MAARQAALGPAQAATPLARRPYDLRHAALSLWLNASSAPAEVAAAGAACVSDGEGVCGLCGGGWEELIGKGSEDAVAAGSPPSQHRPRVAASGPPTRRHRPRAPQPTQGGAGGDDERPRLYG